MAHSKSGSHHHITPIPKLFGTLLVLMIGMVLTIAWYYLFAGGVFSITIKHTWYTSLINNIGMLAIAVFKATLVIQIFMGVKHQTNLVKSYVILGFVWMTLMFLMFADYGTRQWEPVQGWTGEGTKAMPRSYEPNEFGVPPRAVMEDQVHDAAAAHGGKKAH